MKGDRGCNDARANRAGSLCAPLGSPESPVTCPVDAHTLMDNNMDGAGDDDDTESPDTRDDYDDSASLPELVLSSDSDDGEDDDERSPRQMTIVKSSVAPPLNEATLTYGDTCSIAPFVDSLPSAWVSCTLLGVKRVLCRSLLYRNAMTTVLTISLPSTLLYPFASMCDSQQDKDNVSAPDRSSRTLIPPEYFGTSATERLISVSLPPLNPFASMCDFRQDKDNDVRSARPWLNHDTGFGLDLRDDLLPEGFEPDTTLDGAYMVVDAFATYHWDHVRNLWLPVCAQAMVVAVSNHSGWDPGRAF